MSPWRERFAYEWCVAVSAAGLLAISPWVPSIPFSRLLTAWVSWIAQPLLGWSRVAPFDGLVATFVPTISVAILGFPLLTFCSLTLRASRPLVSVARAAVALMSLLSAMAIAETIANLEKWIVFSQIAVGIAVGVLFLVFGIQLHNKHPRSSRIRLLAIILAAAGACLATFVLLPIGLVLLCAAYILWVPILATRQSEAFERAV